MCILDKMVILISSNNISYEIPFTTANKSDLIRRSLTSGMLESKGTIKLYNIDDYTLQQVIYVLQGDYSKLEDLSLNDIETLNNVLNYLGIYVPKEIRLMLKLIKDLKEPIRNYSVEKAIKDGDSKMLQYLIDSGKFTDMNTFPNGKINPEIRYGVEFFSIPLVLASYLYSASIQSYNLFRGSEDIESNQYDIYEICKILIVNGANTNEFDSYSHRIPLSFIHEGDGLLNDKGKLLLLLLENDANPNKNMNDYGPYDNSKIYISYRYSILYTGVFIGLNYTLYLLEYNAKFFSNNEAKLCFMNLYLRIKKLEYIIKYDDYEYFEAYKFNPKPTSTEERHKRIDEMIGRDKVYNNELKQIWKLLEKTFGVLVTKDFIEDEIKRLNKITPHSLYPQMSNYWDFIISEV